MTFATVAFARKLAMDGLNAVAIYHECQAKQWPITLIEAERIYADCELHRVVVRQILASS